MIETPAGARATSGQGVLHDSILDTIGNTPCVRINRLHLRESIAT